MSRAFSAFSSGVENWKLSRTRSSISQIDLSYVNEPDVWVGQTLEFRVTEIREGGRNVVVSRKALLEAERKAAQSEVLGRLSVGSVVSGTVRQIGKHGVVLDLEEGKRIGHALGDHKAVILRNHGLLTVGHSVDEAVWWFITMERSCQAQLLAEAAGTPVLIDDDSATLTASQVGSHVSGYVSFQPLYAKITREQPDLFAEPLLEQVLGEVAAVVERRFILQPLPELRAADLRRGRESVRTGHADVHDDDVGGVFAGEVDGLAAVRRLGDDGHAGVGVDEDAEGGAQERLVVGEQDARGHGALPSSGSRCAGSRAPRWNDYLQPIAAPAASAGPYAISGIGSSVATNTPVVDSVANTSVV